MTSKNHQGGHKSDDNDYSDARLYNNIVVLALKLFLSKRNTKNSAFFQTPIKTYDKTADVWYRKEPLDKLTC